MKSVELGIRNADAICGNATVTVNGRELLHQWDRNNGSGSGSGLIPGSPSFETAAVSEVLATWRRICVRAPPGAPNNCSVQILTVALKLEGQQRQGFTVSFTSTETLEILRLSAVPVDIAQDDPGLQVWRDSDIANQLPNPEIELVTTPLAEPGPNPLEDQIEAELQRLSLLQQDLHRIKHLLDLQEAKIRLLLKQDCQSILSKWEQCEDFRCILRISWQTIPEIFRSISYRLGPLESKKLVPICNSHGHGDSKNNTRASWRPLPTTPPSYPPSTTSITSATTTLIGFHPPETPAPVFTGLPGTEIPSYATPINRPTQTFAWLERLEAGIEIPLAYQVKGFLRSCAIFFLIIAITAFAFRVVRNSSAFRRRRRDLAARQEERRARRAYNNAARRLRWRQWWEGSSYSQTQSVYSSHSLPEAGPVVAADQPQYEDTLPQYEEREEVSREENGAMQNEILGLRRVLEYVGQLVHTNDDPNRRHRSRSRPPRYEDINDTRSAAARTTAVGTSGMNSPRPSSFVSLDTGSLMTLDTLDTLDSSAAPPSYRT